MLTPPWAEAIAFLMSNSANFWEQGSKGEDFDLRDETERIRNKVNTLRGRLSFDDGPLVSLSRPMDQRLGLAIDDIDQTFAGRGRHTLDRQIL